MNFSQQLLDMQLFLLGALHKFVSSLDSIRENLLRLTILEGALETYVKTNGVSVNSDILSIRKYQTLLKKSFEMSLYTQNKFFMEFDRSNCQQKPFVSEQLKRHKEKTKILMEDFKKLSQGTEITGRLFTGSAKIKPSMKKSQFSRPDGARTMRTIKEEIEVPEEGPDANHRMFMTFIHDYYVPK